MRLGRPRHSTVAAYTALFVALGGTSYAALKLPAGSVGSKQIKRNAVNSAKVKNRSLIARDFKRGQLRPGPRGPIGPRGAKGVDGRNGVNGAPGTAAGYMRVNHNAFTNDPDRITDGLGVTINSPPRSKGVVSIRRITSTNAYCFDLTFDAELAVGSAFANNAAIISTSVARDSGNPVQGCPLSHPDAKVIVYDVGSVAHNDVSFGVIFEKAVPVP